MDVKEGQDGLQIEGSWIPKTPVKPILPRTTTIYTDSQGNQLDQAIWLGSDTFSSNFTQASQASEIVACCNSSNCGQVHNCVNSSANKNIDSVGACCIEPLPRWNNLRFADLLALADAASAAAGNVAPPPPQGNDSVATNSFLSVTNCQNGNYVADHSSASLFGNHDLQSKPWTNGHCMAEEPNYELCTPHRQSYDLNLPPRTMSDANSSKTNPQLAPITPEKDMRVPKKSVSDVQHLCANERMDEGETEKQNEGAATRVDTNEVQPNKELSTPVTDSSLAAVSTPFKENDFPDKGSSQVIDLNKTPQQKPRRRKHRPKVITEGKSKRTRKPVTPKPAGSKENPTGKRKYVRRKGIEKPSTTPAEVIGEFTDLKTPKRARKSCRRALNFDVEGQAQDESSTCKSYIDLDPDLPTQDFCSNEEESISTVQLSKGAVKHTEAGIAYDLACSMNQMLKDYISLPERQAPSTTHPTKTDSSQEELNADSHKDNNTEGEGQLIAHDGKENTAKVILKTDNQISPKSPNDSNCSTSAIFSKGEQARQSKRRHSHAAEQADASTTNLAGAQFNILDAYNMMNWMHFPNIHKKKRTEKGQNSTTSSSSSCVTATKNVVRIAKCPLQDAEENPCSSKASHWVSGPQSDAGTVSLTDGGKDLQDNHPSFECILALIQTERSTRKRSRGPTRARNSTSLTNFPECITHPTKQPLVEGDGQTIEIPQNPHTCIEALVAEMHTTLARKKRTKKRNSVVGSASHQKLVLYNHNLPSFNLSGASHEVTWKQMFSIDAIVEQFKHLNINRESSNVSLLQHNAVVPYSMQNQEHNALVLYKRDGTVVPFEGWFDPIKKRRPRPKVDLDEETNRVWKLLLENINSQGIDGTDEEKAKWWEEERRVFRGRADSFIARMHLVQGDRRFSQWKGSVLDSVVGVFLTQNVSDHLSSSAFMSLAAHFPLKSTSNQNACYEEGLSFVVDEPELYILDPEDSIQWKPVCDQSSMTLHDPEHNEEKEVVNSNESPGGSTVAETACYTGGGSGLERNSEADYLLNGSKPNSSDGLASIVELQQMAGSTLLDEFYSHVSGNAPSDENPKDACNESKGMNHDNQRQDIDKINDPQSSLGASMSLSSNYHLHLTSTSRVPEVECSEMFKEETQSSDISQNKDENSVSEQSALTVESSSQDTVQNKPTMNVPKAPRSSSKSGNSVQVYENVIIPSQSQVLGDPKIVESLAQGQNIEVQQSLPSLSGETQDVAAISEMNAATIKAKRRRAAKEKKENVNWDNLRKQVEANGIKRERTANTMDSLDWEAVRCADVNEIAKTIKERGMNNMLAERIKDFLNRLVREHGSTDLEWLRDVPPDQAKEYLLSIRGLGLKSVECVRLLTLHHLAFPVDTNVGRIAVRLGWVPLQPLPESLQLHLLELYPVLESIQKYLWPRLCKLDQRTLYELHYQMITFGKVFCTKSKPNCNACPMRGECRHFASAFASARLALPGPEEKSIVTATENRPAENPTLNIDRLALPLPQECRQLEAKTGVSNCEPIIEEPATPEPECTQAKNDIEDTIYEDPDEIPIIKLNIEEFSQNLQNYMQNNMELQDGDVSKALVALTPEAASIPTPKLKNVSRLRTEHQVYELPDSHPLLNGLDKREPDDPCSYLLAIWTPGETANSIQPPEKSCSSQEYGRLCDKKECFSCNSIREENSQMVRGTILIPCRTAMRGSFPLNGTYFQVNEVFADHDSSLNPIDVPRNWIWNLRRRTVYFGTSIPTIFKGLTTQEIQQCFWKGFVCVRGFDQKSRAPRPLMARLHFPASKLTKTKGKTDD
ncbi:DNA glycosylase/AP lyase ROS1 isoform X2 [Quercus suber]|uniref:DNA glycosylase/AP lyase ROS1 isoform X2 n=1 Tax=Quercus suber TaxID=58331 RepID=UPI000CE1F58C|nr:protein ROS1-like isoform X2 [Quercus suber]